MQSLSDTHRATKNHPFRSASILMEEARSRSLRAPFQDLLPVRRPRVRCVHHESRPSSRRESLSIQEFLRPLDGREKLREASDGPISEKIMKRSVIALVLIALPAISVAAPQTCRDLLVRSPERNYACAVVGGVDAQTSAPFTFEVHVSPNGASTTTFRMEWDNVSVGCTCDPKGSVENPKFWVGKSFTCTGPGVPSTAIAATGRVSGSDGARITQFKILAFNGTDMPSAVTFGKCSLVP